MATEKRLIDADALADKFWQEECRTQTRRDFVAMVNYAPTVIAYTEEQLIDVFKKAHELEAEERELRKQVAWLKSCLNCKIRKECPRHCGKVVHNCDHWEYGDNAVDAVEGGYTAHEVAEILAELFGDSCACNFNGIDERLPLKCELLDACPNTCGVACWEQYLKFRGRERKDNEV